MIESNYYSPFKKDKNRSQVAFSIIYQGFPLFFLCLGILIAFFSSIGYEFFTKRWSNSGLFVGVCTPWILWFYAFTTDRLINKHKSTLKQYIEKEDFNEREMKDPSCNDLESFFNVKPINWFNIPLILLALIAITCHLGEFNIWMKFDVIVFIVWTSYVVLYSLRFHKLKRIIGDCEMKFKE